MNKRDRQQLKASIAKDLIQGQGEHSPTKELLKQYAPLEGIINRPVPGISAQPERTVPVENTMAAHATVALTQHLPWHDATEESRATAAPPATMAHLAVVRGELRVPNTINFSLFPTLDPFAKAVFYQLFLLSHGFRRDTCVVGLAKLAKSLLMSQRKVQDTIIYLETRGLIKRLRAVLGGPAKGNVYLVPIPAADMEPSATGADSAAATEGATLAPYATEAPEATMASPATNKDDDDFKIQSSSKSSRTFGDAAVTAENHRGAAAPREKQEIADRDFALVRAAYESATGNRWNKSDSETYKGNGLNQVPVEKVVSVLESVSRRTPVKINSLKYFVKEISALPDPRNRASQKNQLEKIVRRIRDNSVGRADYSRIDFLEDVKCACAREGMVFKDDIYNELVR